MGDIIFSTLFSMLPIVIWGYLFSYADNSRFSILRFILGIITGAVGVLPIAYSKELGVYFGNMNIFSFIPKQASSFSEIFFSLTISYILPVLIVVGMGIFLAFGSFQKYKKGFLLALTVILIYGGMYGVLLFLGGPFGSENGFELSILDVTLRGVLAIGIAYAFVASVEESVKHMALYPLLKDPISRGNIALAATFGALGFVFLENTLYLSNIAGISGVFSYTFTSTLVSRSIVSLLLHVFASLLLSFGLARVLVEESKKKISVFALYFLSGVFIHALFNVSLTYGKTGIIALYAVIGYFFFTKVFFDERKAL